MLSTLFAVTAVIHTNEKPKKSKLQATCFKMSEGVPSVAANTSEPYSVQAGSPPCWTDRVPLQDASLAENLQAMLPRGCGSAVLATPSGP